MLEEEALPKTAQNFIRDHQFLSYLPTSFLARKGRTDKEVAKEALHMVNISSSSYHLLLSNDLFIYLYLFIYLLFIYLLFIYLLFILFILFIYLFIS